MKHQLGKITVRDTAKAVQLAEAQLEKPEASNGGPVFVDVFPQNIKERLELFQPRRPGWGTRTLDTKYVGKLATRITRKGELDPVVVVKLRIPTKPAMHSNMKPAARSEMKPAMVPI
jgi:hypothetical protein